MRAYLVAHEREAASTQAAYQQVARKLVSATTGCVGKLPVPENAQGVTCHTNDGDDRQRGLHKMKGLFA